MRIFDKIMMLIYSIFILIVSLVIMLLPFDINNIFSIDSAMNTIYSLKGNYLVSFIGLALFIISLWYLFSIMKVSKKKDKPSFLALNNEYGEIVIYEDTVSGLVKSVSKEFAGIENIKTIVKFKDGKIDLSLRGEALKEISIPEISRELQFKIKEHVEEVTGAEVSNVNVEIFKVSETSIIK